jgi:hypothetical protein
MSFKFLVEVQSLPPKFISKKTTSRNQLDIFQTLQKDIVYTGSHKDTIYNSKIKRCEELDCSEYYNSANVTGVIPLCAECLPYIERPPGNDPGGPCIAFNSLSSVNFGNNLPTNIQVTNSDSTTLTNYNTWSSNNNFLSRSGYWLGFNPCNGGSTTYQCLVNCSNGNVAGCWNTSGGSGSFGNVHSIGGANYQIYDPVQIWLSGLRPNDGTFPLLSNNPITGNTSTGTSCGTTYTILGSGSGGSNCLIRQEPSFNAGDDYSSCETPNTDIGSSNFITGNVAVLGDYSGGAFSFSSGGCGFAGNTTTSERFALGGTTVTDIVTFDSIGITGAFDSCKSCLQASENAPSCCEVSYGAVTINGAPSFDSTTSTWGSGSGAWNDWTIIPSDLPSNDPNTFKNSCVTPLNGELANGTGYIPCVAQDSLPDTGCQNNITPKVTGVFIFWNCDVPNEVDDEGNEIFPAKPAKVYGRLPKLTADSCSTCNDTPVGVWEVYNIYPFPGTCNGTRAEIERRNGVIIKNFKASVQRGSYSFDTTTGSTFSCPSRTLLMGGGFGLAIPINPGEDGYNPGKCCNNIGYEFNDSGESHIPGSELTDSCNGVFYDPPIIPLPLV